jgi:5-methylcytosine-specific restriction endonuclease McrA
VWERLNIAWGGSKSCRNGKILRREGQNRVGKAKTCVGRVKTLRGEASRCSKAFIKKSIKRLMEIISNDEATKKSVYAAQTEAAKEKAISNCPLCALGHDSNKTRVWKLAEMDADHVSAWSKGGATDIKNCQMLCKTHNRAKGNK